MSANTSSRISFLRPIFILCTLMLLFQAGCNDEPTPSPPPAPAAEGQSMNAGEIK